MKKLLCTVAAVLMLSGCATASSGTPAVPAGPLQAEIRGKSKEDIADKISALCYGYGFSIQESSSNAVICSRRSSTMAQLMFSTKYGSDVESKLKMNIMKIGEDTIMVQPETWLESMNGFGAVNKQPISPYNQDVQLIFNDLNAYAKGQ